MSLLKKATIGYVLLFASAFSVDAMEPKRRSSDGIDKKSSSLLLRRCLTKNLHAPYHQLIDQLADDSTRSDVIEKLKISIAKDDDFATHSQGDVPLIVYTAKKYASFTWIVPVIELLLNAGADVNAFVIGPKPLHIASMANNVDLAKLLIQHGAGVNVSVQDSCYVPLHIACACGFKDLFDVFIEAGADINVRDKWGATPLHFAAGRGQESAQGGYQMILPKGTDYKFYEVQIAKRCHIIQVLISRGAIKDAHDMYNFTPLDFAQAYGHEELVVALSGALPIQPDESQI